MRLQKCDLRLTANSDPIAWSVCFATCQIPEGVCTGSVTEFKVDNQHTVTIVQLIFNKNFSSYRIAQKIHKQKILLQKSFTKNIEMLGNFLKVNKLFHYKIIPFKITKWFKIIKWTHKQFNCFPKFNLFMHH